MAYTVNVNGVPTLNSFEEAERFFDKTAPWRNHARENERPLDRDGRRKQHMRIVKQYDYYECYLYRTPVVAYHRSGLIRLKAHASRSTNMFVNKLLPLAVRPQYTDRTYFVSLRPHRLTPYPNPFLNPNYEQEKAAYDAWWGAERVYKFKGSTLDITLRDGIWEVCDLDQTEPWRKYKVDMPKYNKLLKELGYKDFMVWWKAARALNGGEGWKVPTNYFAALTEGPEYWTELKLYNNPDAPRHIRQAIIRARDVATVVEEQPYLTKMWRAWTYEKNNGKFGL